jgi:hypothetical protein
MSRSLPLALVLLVLTAAGDARAQQVDRLEIVEWGLFRLDRDGKVPAPRGATGETTLVRNIRLEQATTTVPALLGMKFGLRLKVVGSPPGATVDLRTVFRLPTRGITNPRTGRTYFSTEFDMGATIGDVTYRGYQFDYDWEVEPGPWVLEVWHDGRKLAEKTFMVTRLVSSAGRQGRQTVR